MSYQAAGVRHSCALAYQDGAQTQRVSTGSPGTMLASTVAITRTHDLVNTVCTATLFSFPSRQLCCVDHRTRNNDTCDESAEGNSADAANLRDAKAEVKLDMPQHASV